MMVTPSTNASRSRLSRFLVLSTFLSLWSVPAAQAITPDRRITQYGHTAWRVQDGAVARSSTIAQTKDGYIWLGSSDGLMRFDGVRFVKWQPPKGEKLSSRIFTSLLGSSDGSLWIGTSWGLSRWKDGELKHYTDPSNPVGISVIIEDRAGTVWLTRYHLHGDEGPLCKVDGDKLQCFGKKDGLPATYGLGLAEDSAGNLWLASKMLYRWKPGSPATAYLADAFAKQPTNDGIIDVAVGRADTVWATLNGTGPELGVRQFSDGEWKGYVVPGFDGRNVLSHALYLDRHNTLWVGTENDGIYRIHDGVADHYSTADGLSGNSIVLFFEDREGNLWVMTDGGVDMFRSTPVVSFTTREGIFTASVTSVLAMRNGTVWIGDDYGVNVLRPDGPLSQFSRLAPHGKAATSILEDHAGTVWLGLENELRTYRDGKFHEIRSGQGQAFAGTKMVIGIVEDARHRIWVLTSAGRLFSIVGDAVKEETLAVDNPGSLRYLATDPKDGIWIGSDQGLIYHYSDGQMQKLSMADAQGPLEIHHLFANSDGSVAVSTARGFYWWDGSRFSTLTAGNGLPCDDIYSAIQDNHGALWLNARCALIKVDASELAKWHADPNAKPDLTILGAFDGAHPSRVESYQPTSKGPDGRLWFTAAIMAQMVDPDHLNMNTIPPPVHVEEVIADRKVLDPTSTLQIPPLTRNLQIDFTALSYTIPQRVRFRYMLEGHDREWQDAGTRRQAFYSDLAPGDYHFRVTASNNDGVWNEAGASLALTVLPAYYQTVWFRAACAALFLLFLYALYQLRLRRVHRQFQIGLDARVAERTRIARDLHDTLLQSFHGSLLRFQASSNLLPARPDEAKRKLDNAIDAASDAIAEARGAVEGLRTSSGMSSDLAVAIKTLGEELAFGDCQSKPPSLEVTVEGEARDLNPIVRDELYRIIAEALRNAYHHAKANQIEVEIRYDTKLLRVRIRDDGTGIDPQILDKAGRTGHYGLHGMRERARLMGGNLEVWSNVKSGTEIEVTVPASNAFSDAQTLPSSYKKGA